MSRSTEPGPSNQSTHTIIELEGLSEYNGTPWRDRMSLNEEQEQNGNRNVNGNDQTPSAENGEGNWFNLNVSGADVVDHAAQAGIPISENEAANLIDIFTRLTEHVRTLRELELFVPDGHVANSVILFIVICILITLRAFYNHLVDLLVLIIHFFHYRDYYKLVVFRPNNFWRTFSYFVIRNVFTYLVFDHSLFVNVLRLNRIEGGFFYLLFAITVSNLMVMDVCLVLNIFINRFEFMDKMHRNQTIKIMEHIFVLYISLLPIIQWYNYIGNLWLSLPYLILKFIIYAFVVYRLYQVVKQQFSTKHIGQTVHEAEIGDDSCAICLNPMKSGVKLSCGHVFEENCVRKWLDDHNDCPLCRKNVIVNWVKYEKIPLCPPYLF